MIGRRSIAALFAAAFVCLAPSSARADDDNPLPDARLMGYDNRVELGGGSASSYALIAILGAIAVGITFKNSGRTHLD